MNFEQIYAKTPMQISCKTNATFHDSTTHRRKLSGEREELLGMSEGVHRGVGARRRGDHDGFGLLLFLEDEQARMVSRQVLSSPRRISRSSRA